MRDLADITPLEEEGYRASPEKLAEAMRLLSERWTEGARDRETALRLLFLVWYDCAEPPFTTDDAACSFEELFEHLGGECSDDGELLYAVGVMAELFPYCCGPEDLWRGRAARCFARSRELLRGLPTPERFGGRGAYGLYFQHVARVHRPSSNA